MNKVIQAELKKTVSKPGIYILALLLAAIMVLGVFIYKPTIKKDEELQFTGDSILQIYQNDFGDGTSYGFQATADENVENAKKSLTNYYIDDASYSTKVAGLKKDFDDYFKAYEELAFNTVASKDYIKEAKSKMVDAFEKLYSTINSGLNLNNQNSYPIVTTKANYDNFTMCYNDAHALLNAETSKISETCNEYTNLYKPEIDNCLTKLYYPTISVEKIKDYTEQNENSKCSKYVENKNAILKSIVQLRDEAQNSDEANCNEDKISSLKTLIANYYNYSLTYSNLIKYDLLTNALSTVKITDKGSLLYLENQTQMDSNSWFVKYEYLFEHNKNLADFANPLTIGIASNGESNGYDYAYFIIRMFSFVIIAYAIMAGAHTIAGEIKEGTMRYLAIRPIKRTSILFGKFLAIAIMSIILILFSGLISIVVGSFIYGLDTQTILTVFAGKYAITLHPVVMIIVYLISLILELLVYLSIAILLSTFIKSDIVASTILMVIYLINVLLPIFAYSSIGWLAYYPFSHISLYSLFGSSLVADANNTFNLLMGAKVYSTTNFALTIVTILLIIGVCNLVSAKIFKHKEI